MNNLLHMTERSLFAVAVLLTLPLFTQAATLNFDIDKAGSVVTHTGTAIAPDLGTTWNSVPVPQSTSGYVTIADCLDSDGNTTGVGLSVDRDSGGTMKVYDSTSGGNPNPVALMRDYAYWGGWTIALSGLTPGTYDVYIFGQSNGGTGSTWTLDAANGGASGTTLAGVADFRDLYTAGAEGNTYIKLTATVDGSGILVFTGGDNLNGFQIQAVATSQAPAIGGLDDETVVAGSDLTLKPIVSGSDPISYQWKENGSDMAGETNDTLTLINVQLSQDGYVYSLVASNVYGAATNSMLLTVLETSPGVEMTINVDVDKSSGDHYTGTAVAPDSGTVWNSFLSLGTLGAGSVQDSQGSVASGVTVAFSSSDGSLSVWNDTGSGSPYPLKLMSDYTYNRNYTFDITGLVAGQKFALYAYAHGNVDDQTSTITLDGANGGDSGSTSQTGDFTNFRNTSVWGDGYNYVKLLGDVDGSGNVSFDVNPYCNGFQLQLLASPVISGLTNQTVIAETSTVLSPAISGTPPLTYQWMSNSIPIAGETNEALVLTDVQYAQDGTVYALAVTNDAGSTMKSMTLSVIVTPAIDELNNQAVAPGSLVTMAPTVSGVPAPGLQWFYNGGLLSDGATGNGSTISGSASDTLSIANAQVADSGTYSLVAGNSAGIVTNSMTLTVSASDVPPEITGPTHQTEVQGSDAVFSASVAGLPLPTIQWKHNGSSIPGATNDTLTVSNVVYAQDGDVYSIVASNAAGTATNSATLYVLVPPSISQQPTNTAVTVGSPALFSVTASGVPAVSYQWSRDGSPIAGATNATYSIANVQGSDNDAVFSVVVSNSVDTVTSSDATLTALSTMTGTLLPTDGATEIAPDQQLRIVFSGGTPELSYTGKKLYVRDASDDSLFATIDTSLFQSFATDSATVNNAFIRSVQGNSFYYMPIAIYGNEAWITLNSNERFEYGKTYYVTFDTGLFVDGSGASFPGIDDSSTWEFSTKASGPGTPTASTGPTEITVGLDGAGDFATLQGASDWIPQNNTLERTISILPGTYHDFAVFYQDRDFVNVVGTGADREDVQIIYPNAAFTSGSSSGMIRIEDSDDLYFKNLTLDNEVYIANPLNNYGPFPGRLNVLVYKYAERLIFDNVLIKGGQDTLYADSGIGYFNGCEIWGSVDFIYGTALAVFEECDIVQIRETGGPVCAPKTDYNAPYGEVFLNCTFPRALIANGYPYNVQLSSTTFMRPWGQDGHTAIINCELDTHFSTKGWGEWSGRETTCRAREYGSTMIGGGAAPTPAARRSAGAYWLNTIDPDYTNPSMSPTDALLYGSGTANRVLVTVDPADYTIDAIFGHAYYGLGSWRPELMTNAAPPVITLQPVGQAVAAGATVSLLVEASTFTGTTNYLWQVDAGAITEGNVSGIGSSMLTITGFQAANEGTYRVIVDDGAISTNSGNALLTLAAAPSMVFDGVASNMLALEIPTEWGPSYMVLTNTDLTNSNGWGVADTIIGDGAIHPFVTTVTNVPELFIRVIMQ